MCARECNRAYVELCDRCFEQKKKRLYYDFPRRTGRTTKLIKELVRDKRAFLLVESYHGAREWQRKYPELRNRIISTGNLDDWRGIRIDISKLYVDHYVFEKAQSNFAYGRLLERIFHYYPPLFYEWREWEFTLVARDWYALCLQIMSLAEPDAWGMICLGESTNPFWMYDIEISDDSGVIE